MNEQNTKKLFERFNFFHPERPVTEGLMAYGFACGDGWFELVWNLCEAIEEKLKENPVPNFEVIQVKEKFGGLRFYTSVANDDIYELIDDAEDTSYQICEVCGSNGQQYYDGWVSTLCEKCKKELDKK